MTGARHVVLSLVAAGLALLLGVVLGAGPVTEQAAADRAAASDRLRDRLAELEQRTAALTAAAKQDARAAAALAAPLVADRVAGRSVLLVATPGARTADVRSTAAVLEDAGATVTATLTLTDTYVDPAKAQSPLEDLSLRLVPPGVEFPDGALPIERVGTVLARATVRLPEGDEGDGEATDEVDRDAAEVLAGLDELQAVHLDGTPGRRAELAVVVTGPGDDAESAPALSGLFAALDRGSRGAVLTGPGDASDGLLSDVRKAERPDLDGVSTVDSAGTTVGSAALVLALAEQVGGRAGDYGLGALARRVLPLAADG
ncbi:MAG TPA: copper transporter [Actinomycetes bacterium]|nr:copper transporter [Actinomycetes bacterium]